MYQPPREQFFALSPAVRAASAEKAPTRWVGFMAVLGAVLKLPVAIIEKRRCLSLLASMDDRELRDIGLCRQDLRDAVTEPVGRAVGSLLSSRAAERRLAALSHSALR